MLVDSYRFLPRSFIPLYENPVPLPGEDTPVWAPFEKRLSEASVAVLSSAGLYLAGEQEPFDLERERQEPTWGDPSWRELPASLGGHRLGMTHLHVNSDDVLADPNIALPLDLLDLLVAEGRIAAAGPSHISVMGYQDRSLTGWREETAPAIVSLLRGQGTDGVVLAPV